MQADSFGDTANAFLDLVRRIEPDQWDLPGLGEWSVRDLVGHTSRAISTLELYLTDDAPATVTVPSAEQYYLRVFDGHTDNAAVAARGRAAGWELGDAAAARIAESLSRVRTLLAEQPADRTVAIGSLAIPLAEYLRTREFELVVHGLDLAHCTGIPIAIPPAALTGATVLAAGVAAQRGRAEELLFALTGRDALPDDFTIF
ncbi:uncharacterized protein (TIGR03083 family) [Glaciihabitans tibetensis]|uniref:Uncharacterized protein (TIGR03083 family) n=2 Tax=Glaciihabitans tibetensis TaxID=1266600 RepID=A0A2T0VD56_9MICO|nr:uncharacterized protein (TIGR03083 family) [Glaciihabitans tibetensis]